MISPESGTKKSSVTIRDVAKHAGVSVSTVSAVLNAKEGIIRVSDSSRAKIFEAARKLDYRPNASAKGLRTGRSYLIGIVVGSVTLSFIPEVLQGIETELIELGYNSLLSTYDSPQEFRHKSQVMAQKNVDGVIIFPSDELCYRELYPELLTRFPAISVGGFTPIPGVPSVRTTGQALAELGTRHLLELGHRRIALLLGGCLDRLDGYRRALTGAGIAFDPELVLERINTYDDGVANFRRLIELPGNPTAVLTQSDEVAAGVISAAHDANVAIPGRLSVMGVDDLPLARMIYPRLTTVAQPKLEHGRLAAANLIRRIGGEKDLEKLTVRFTPWIETRASCSPPSK